MGDVITLSDHLHHNGEIEVSFDEGLLDLTMKGGGFDSIDTTGVTFQIYWADSEDDPEHNPNHLPVFILRVNVPFSKDPEDDDFVAEDGDQVGTGVVLGLEEMVELRDALNAAIEKVSK
jgi:hypothetical protein